MIKLLEGAKEPSRSTRSIKIRIETQQLLAECFYQYIVEVLDPLK